MKHFSKTIAARSRKIEKNFERAGGVYVRHNVMHHVPPDSSARSNRTVKILYYNKWKISYISYDVWKSCHVMLGSELKARMPGRSGALFWGCADVQ
jgi:hypothetical protein